MTHWRQYSNFSRKTDTPTVKPWKQQIMILLIFLRNEMLQLELENNNYNSGVFFVRLRVILHSSYLVFGKSFKSIWRKYRKCTRGNNHLILMHSNNFSKLCCQQKFGYEINIDNNTALFLLLCSFKWMNLLQNKITKVIISKHVYLDFSYF